MRTLAKIIIYILTFLVSSQSLLGQISYEIDYRESSDISDKKGNPNGVDTPYLPQILFQHMKHYVKFDDRIQWIDANDVERYRSEFGEENIKDSLIYYGLTELDQKWISRYLYEFEEPVLYNYYLREDVIRLTFLRAFDKPIMIKLSRQGDSATLNIKRLNNQIDVGVFRDLLQGNHKTISDPQKLTELQENKIVKIDKPTLLYLDSLMLNTKIKNEIPDNNTMTGFDGLELIVEIHSSSGYYFIKRMNPSKDSAIWEIAEFLMKASKSTEVIH